MQATNLIFQGTMIEGLVETLRYATQDSESKTAYRLAISMINAENDGLSDPYTSKLDLNTRARLLKTNRNLRQWIMEYYKERFPL